MNSKTDINKQLPDVSEQVVSLGASLYKKAKTEIGLIPIALIIGALIIFR